MSEMLNPDEVALLLKRSTSWLYKNYKKLQKTRNFPRPVKLNGYNLQWSSRDVDFWFDTHINTDLKINDNRAGSSYEKLLAANAALL